MGTRVTKKAKEEMKKQIKEQSSPKSKTTKKIPSKQPAPIIFINDDYKVKVTRYSYDLFRKQDKSIIEDDIPDDEDMEAGWSCLGHFGHNSWNRIRKEVFNDMVLRKLVKLKEIDLEKFSTLCEKISKEIQKIFSSNNDILLDNKEKSEEKKVKTKKITKEK